MATDWSRVREAPTATRLDDEEFAIIVFTGDDVLEVTSEKKLEEGENGWLAQYRSFTQHASILERKYDKEALLKNVCILKGKGKVLKSVKATTQEREAVENGEKRKAEEKEEKQKKWAMEKSVLKERNSRDLQEMRQMENIKRFEDSSCSPRHSPYLSSNSRYPATSANISSDFAENSPCTQAANNSCTPTIDTPNTPAPNFPHTQAQNTPNNPAPNTPCIPATSTSCTPTIDTPCTPATNTPCTPTIDTPCTGPATNTPNPSTTSFPGAHITAASTTPVTSRISAETATTPCAACPAKDARISELENELALLRKKAARSEEGKRQRPGRMGKDSAVNMVELSMGTRVFLYQHQLTCATKKKNDTGVACHLLDCFYTPEELLQAGRLAALDDVIVAAIVDFAVRAKNGRPAAVKQALRSKIQGLIHRAKSH